MRFQISTVVLLVSFGISALAAPLGTSTNTVDITSSNGVSTPAPGTACECPTNLNRPRHILPRALPADVNPGDWVNVLNTIGEKSVSTTRLIYLARCLQAHSPPIVLSLPKVGFTTEERANSYRKFWQVFNASVKINKDAILEYALDREGLARHLLAHSPEEQRPELLKHLIGYRLL
ncbi:hypothetical protein FRB99_008757, partial [Tulasnella sp. 403]